MLLIAVALSASVLPLARRIGTPTALVRWMQTPLTAALTIAGTNAVIILITFGSALLLTRTGMGILFPAILGPVLSFTAWAQLGGVMPAQGRQRWMPALLGMSPYLLLAAGGTWWSFNPGQSGADPFMAGMAALMITVIGLGAFSLGAMTIAVSRRPKQ